jgi:hypothetical protein
MNPGMFKPKIDLAFKVPTDQFDRSIDEIRTPPATGGAGSAVITHPFQIIDASDGSGANIRVRYGTVEDVVPTLDGDSLSINPVHALASDGTYLVYLEVAYDNDGTVTSAVVNVDLAGTLPDHDDNTDFITLGEVDAAEVESVLQVAEIRQAVTHSLRHGICNRELDGETITESGTPYFWGV